MHDAAAMLLNTGVQENCLPRSLCVSLFSHLVVCGARIVVQTNRLMDTQRTTLEKFGYTGCSFAGCQFHRLIEQNEGNAVV